MSLAILWLVLLPTNLVAASPPAGSGNAHEPGKATNPGTAPSFEDLGQPVRSHQLKISLVTKIRSARRTGSMSLRMGACTTARMAP